MTILMIILNVVPQPSILILVRHKIWHRIIFDHMFQGYVNFTRILFTLSFISCIVCFVFGCLAYSNRERRIWYKTLGKIFQRIYVLEFLNILKVGFLLQFHWSLLYRSSFFQVRLQIIIMGFFCMLFLWKLLVGFLKHYPIYVNWFFGVGYGFGWAALCLNVSPLSYIIGRLIWTFI